MAFSFVSNARAVTEVSVYISGMQPQPFAMLPDTEAVCLRLKCSSLIPLTSFVRSVTMDQWKEKEERLMEVCAIILYLCSTLAGTAYV